MLASGKPERSSPRSNQANQTQYAPHDSVDEPLPPGEFEDDPIERMARNGFAALERFGAEIEAIFVPPNGAREAAAAPANGTMAAPPPEPQATGRPTVSEPETLATVEAELRRVLAEEGIVVRGHDVARVVKLATSKDVTWTE